MEQGVEKWAEDRGETDQEKECDGGWCTETQGKGGSLSLHEGERGREREAVEKQMRGKGEQAGNLSPQRGWVWMKQPCGLWGGGQ